MSAVVSFFKCLTGRTFRKSSSFFSFINSPLKRNFADTPKPDTTTKHVVVQGTENEQQLRVRRARASDVPRVLRFVREHARTTWPGLPAPPSVSHLVLSDYVTRALAQGHSMLAEQQENRRGWSAIRGIALGTAVCPWDAIMLERWARCVGCTRSRRLMHFTAHCLRAPALHDKYHVHNILQVVLCVPPDNPKSTDIVHILAKNAIQRGKDVGFPLIRFDVTDNDIANALEGLKLKKEWYLSYEAFPELVKEMKEKKVSNTSTSATDEKKMPNSSISATDSNLANASTNNQLDKKLEVDKKTAIIPAHFVTVYTASTQADKS
ncbi:uncharacterized protein ACR2FA_007770 [Aphomia sociella]